METIAPFITAITTAIAIMSALWVYRKTDRVGSVHLAFAFGIIIFATYHFFACGFGLFDSTYGVITGLFISLTAAGNAYCSTCIGATSIKIGVNRRKADIIPHLNLVEDRRQINSHLIFKEINKA